MQSLPKIINLKKDQKLFFRAYVGQNVNFDGHSTTLNLTEKNIVAVDR